MFKFGETKRAHWKITVIVPFPQFKDLTIEFRSDYQYQFRGFYIAGRQISCNTFISKNPFRPPLAPSVPPSYPYTARPPHLHLPPSTLANQSKVPPITLVTPAQKYPPPHTTTTFKPNLPHRPSTYYPLYSPPPVTYTPRTPVVPLVPTFTPPRYTAPPFVSCDLTFSTPQGQFQSLNYPENYASNLSCDLRYLL